MRFGKTLRASIYEPWREYYVDYEKLKGLLREKEIADEDADAWTELDESNFVEQLVNVQLEKVNSFHARKGKELNDRTAACESKLDVLLHGKKEGDEKGEGEEKKDENKGDGDDKEEVEGKEEGEDDDEAKNLEGKEEQLKEVSKELDAIMKEVNELEKFSRVNFTGFLKAAKKHDRLRPKYKVRPLLQVRLSAVPFNSEDYSPLLYRISAMYSFIRQHTEKEKQKQQQQQSKRRDSSVSGVATAALPESKRYESYKFWIHPDNLLEVKTYILRRLPVLLYNPQPSKVADPNRHDPTITSLYLDSPKFSLYGRKLDRHQEGTSLRLRWYGNLQDRPDIYLEKKTIPSVDNPEGVESAERLPIKEKQIQSFITGENALERQVQKMKDMRSKTDEDVKKFEALIKDMQSLLLEEHLQPVLRATYKRTGFQIPGDNNSPKVSLDTDLVFIREDALDEDRPCRNPDDWCRRDLQDYPFDNVRKGEVSRFPYSILRISIPTAMAGRSREWLNDLMNSHLVHDAPRFSKFLHGIAVLFEDHVNTFPFWLSELDKDIRKDPKTAWEQEQEKIKKQAEDDIAVGSLVGSAPHRGTPPVGGTWGMPGSHPSPSRAMDSSPSRAAASQATPPLGHVLPAPIEEEDESEEEDEVPNGDNERQPRSRRKMLRYLFPTMKSSSRQRRHSVHLPPSVRKPTSLIKDEGPLQVEAKVWLANQRTFIKWQHISILLASLSLGLYNAAGSGNTIAQALGVLFTAVAVFAGVWGWGMYVLRSKWITQRSGKDFDNPVGPIVVCITLIIALVANFVFKWQSVMEDMDKDSMLGNMTLSFSFNRKDAMILKQGP